MLTLTTNHLTLGVQQILYFSYVSHHLKMELA